MYLVGKEYIGDKIKRYIAVINRSIMSLSEEQYIKHRKLKDIRNVDADDSNLLVIRDGRSCNNNVAVLVRDGYYTSFVFATDVFLVLSQDNGIFSRRIKDGTYSLINSDDFCVYGYNRTFEDYNKYAYMKYTEYTRKKPKPMESFYDDDWVYVYHIMRTFYTAEYNDWMRWLART